MKYILIASNGTEIETTQYNTKEEAETALKEATEMWINKEHPIDDLEYSYIGSDSAFLCPLDTDINEDWKWEIISVKPNYPKDLLVCTEFTCEEDLTKYKDSMMFDSGENIATGKFQYNDQELNIYLDISGEVAVTFEGVTYHRPSEFPEELKEKIRKNPNNWEYSDESDIYVGLNNWFEYIYDYNGVVFEDDLSKATPQRIRIDMQEIAEQYFGINS